MKSSHLQNKATKTKDPKDISKYKKQHNYVVKLNNQSNQEHFDSLNPFLDSKSCKPYCFNNHCFSNSKFSLNENGEILPQNIKIAKTFNSNFELLRDSLELFDWTPQFNIFEDKVQNVAKHFPIILVLIKSNKNSI